MKKTWNEKVKEFAEEGKIAEVTSEDFCSVCGKPENNMYIFDGERDIQPHRDNCFEKYMSEKLY